MDKVIQSENTNIISNKSGVLQWVLEIYPQLNNLWLKTFPQVLLCVKAVNTVVDRKNHVEIYPQT